MSLISLCILLLGLLSALDSFVAAKSASSPTDLIIDAQSRLTNTWKSKDFVEVTSYLVVLTLSYRDPSTKVAVPYDERNVSIRPSVNTTFIIDEKGQTVEKVFSPTSPYVGVTNTFGRISFSIPLPDGKLKSPGLHVSAVPSSSKSHYLNRKEYLIYPDTDAIHQLANISPEIIKSLNANIDPKTSQATSQMIRHVMSMSLKSDLNLPKSRRRRRLAKRSTNPFETAFNDHQDETTYDEKTSSIFTWAVDYTPDNIRRILPKPRDTWSYHLSQTLVHNNYVASYAKGEYKLQKRKVGKTVDITAVNFDDSKIEVLGVEAVEKDQNGFIAILRDGIEGVVKTVVKSVKDAIEVVKKLFKTLGIELKKIVDHIKAFFNWGSVTRSKQFVAHYLRTLFPLQKFSIEIRRDQYHREMTNMTETAFNSIDEIVTNLDGRILKSPKAKVPQVQMRNPASNSIFGKFVEDRLVQNLGNGVLNPTPRSDSIQNLTANYTALLAQATTNFTKLARHHLPDSLLDQLQNETLAFTSDSNIITRSLSHLLLKSKKLIYHFNNAIFKIGAGVLDFMHALIKIFDVLLLTPIYVPWLTDFWNRVVLRREKWEDLSVLDLYSFAGGMVYTFDYRAWHDNHEPLNEKDIGVLLKSKNPFFFAEDYTMSMETGKPSADKRYEFRCKYDWLLQATKLSMNLIKASLGKIMDGNDPVRKFFAGVLGSTNTYISAAVTFYLTHMEGELSTKALAETIVAIPFNFWLWWAWAFIPIILTQTRWLIELGITNARYGWFNLAITGVPETIFIVLAIKHVLPKIDWKDPKRVLGVSFSLWAWAMSLVSCYFSAPANNQIREIARIADYLKVLANFGRLQVMMATDLLSLTSIGI